MLLLFLIYVNSITVVLIIYLFRYTCIKGGEIMEDFSFQDTQYQKMYSERDVDPNWLTNVFRT